MDDKKAKTRRTHILLLSVTTFVISIIASLLISGLLVWLLFGKPTSDAELFSMYGDLGTSFMLIVFFWMFPALSAFIGLLTYTCGYIYARRKENQSQFRNYWLLYPIFSITITVILYLAPYWLPFLY